jgi:hypothetical protein
MAREKGLVELLRLERVGVTAPRPVSAMLLLLPPAMFQRLLSMAAGVALITAFRYSSASTLLGTSWAWWLWWWWWFCGSCTGSRSSMTVFF